MKRWLNYKLMGACALLCCAPVLASIQDDVGYTQLQNQLGASTPDGTSVTVFQIEAGDDWMPDTVISQFAGKTIVDLDALPSPGISAHATGVGILFYGLASSTSPAITNIGVHSANGWIFEHLEHGTGIPDLTQRRIANHSWVGNGLFVGEVLSPTETSSLLRVSDWVSDVDELIQSYGIANNNNLTNTAERVLMATAFNGLNVGVTDITHAYAIVPLDTVYVAGRAGIHAVVPQGSTSNSTTIGSSLASLLVEAANSNPAWSSSTRTTRSGLVVQNAGRSETIKAAIMAGAARTTANTAGLGNVIDYRVHAAHQTSNGLDTRYGAGQINIARSYNILAAGEQSSLEDGGSANIGYRGFDHDAVFGGVLGSNTVATYDLGTTAEPIDLTVSLVWHLQVAGSVIPPFNDNVMLHNLDLELIDVTNGGVVAASSTSTIDNTENIWLTLNGGTHYQLRVTKGVGQPDFMWDYSIAWTDSPETVESNVPLPGWMFLALASLFASIFYHMTILRRRR